VCLEPGKEVFDPTEEFNKRFGACGSILCRLEEMGYKSTVERLKKKTHDKENVDSRKNDICSGEYLIVNVRTQIVEATC
jgi:hypothetical protein